MKKNLWLISIVLIFTSCIATYQSRTIFPPADQLFITSGDGDIAKPYTPIGQFLYIKAGYRIPIFLLGFIDTWDVDPDEVLKSEVYSKIREMGGDGLINMSISWEPPKTGFFGFGAKGGHIYITGTVINR